MPRLDATDLTRLDRYPFVVVSWVGDDRYPVSVATTFETDPERHEVILRESAGDAVAIPTDREVNVIGSHIRPTPGQGYDERRYIQLWGRVSPASQGKVVLTPARAWGWDEAEVPFFEYSELSVPQSRRYLDLLSTQA